MSEQLQIRAYGDPSLPTLIYLPGTHGDWTLIPGFRKALSGHVRFVEFTYPRTLTWSLDDYAEAIENALQNIGITSGWLLAESFGSQIVWPILKRKQFEPHAVILAGGFVRHPIHFAVKSTEWLCRTMPLWLLRAILYGYAIIARIRFRNSPEVVAGLREFFNRRTELDRQAAVHRLRLIANNDPCAIARETTKPVFAITGFIDPVVPWIFVRRWLKNNCKALREYKIVWHADHNVLGTGTATAATQVLKWMAVNT